MSQNNNSNSNTGNILQPRRQNFEVHPRRLLPSLQNFQQYNILLKEGVNSSSSIHGGNTLPPLTFIRPNLPVVYSSESGHCYQNVEPMVAVSQPPPLLQQQPENKKLSPGPIPSNLKCGRVGGISKRPPSSVAKRNARERNRVRQVNQGFHNLRQYIPDNFRVKKMSKVDTLHCALEYIRTLECILMKSEPTEETPIKKEEHFDFHGNEEDDESLMTKFCQPSSDQGYSLSSQFCLEKSGNMPLMLGSELDSFETSSETLNTSDELKNEPSFENQENQQENCLP